MERPDVQVFEAVTKAIAANGPYAILAFFLLFMWWRTARQVDKAKSGDKGFYKKIHQTVVWCTYLLIVVAVATFLLFNWPPSPPYVVHGVIEDLAQQTSPPEKPGDKPYLTQDVRFDGDYYWYERKHTNDLTYRNVLWTVIHKARPRVVRIELVQNAKLLASEPKSAEEGILIPLPAVEAAASSPRTESKEPLKAWYQLDLSGVPDAFTDSIRLKYVPDNARFERLGKIQLMASDGRVLRELLPEPTAKVGVSRKPPWPRLWNPLVAFAQQSSRLFDARGNYDPETGRLLRRDLGSLTLTVRRNAEQLLISQGERSLKFIRDTLALPTDPTFDRTLELQHLGNALLAIDKNHGVPDEMYLPLALRLHQLGDHKSAVTYFDKAGDSSLRKEPSNYYLYGSSAWHTGDWKRAIDCFEKYLESNAPPVSPAARSAAMTNLGMAHSNLGQEKEKQGDTQAASQQYSLAFRHLTSARKSAPGPPLTESIDQNIENVKAAIERASRRAQMSPTVVRVRLDGKSGSSGSMTVTFVDVYGEPLKDQLSVSLRRDGRVVMPQRDIDGGSRLEISGNAGLYQLAVDGRWHRRAMTHLQLVRGGSGSFRVVMAVDSSKKLRLIAPGFDELKDDLRAVLARSTLPGFTGRRLYDSLDDPSKAGLLNVWAKMNHTRFANGRAVSIFVHDFMEVRADRLLARAAPELLQQMQESVSFGVFYAVPGNLRKPPAGFSSRGSFKTSERSGILQLTFHSSGKDLVIDAEIDKASGLAQAFNVLSSGGEPHPFDIHEILVGSQSIDPGYRIVQ